MNFARVVGTVVSTRKLECLEGEKLLLLQPLDEHLKPRGERLVATDMTSSGPGEIVFFETGREAAIALRNTWNVSDATVTGIVDRINHETGMQPAKAAKRTPGGKPPADAGDVLIVEVESGEGGRGGRRK